MAPPPRSSILLVDIDHNQRRSLAIGLRLLGHRAEEASCAEEAMERCRAEGFDLVVVDLLLPDMSGLTLARRLSTEFPRMSLLLTCVYDVPRWALEREGVDGLPYLSKPLRTEDIVRMLPRNARRATRA